MNVVVIYMHYRKEEPQVSSFDMKLQDQGPHDTHSHSNASSVVCAYIFIVWMLLFIKAQ